MSNRLFALAVALFMASCGSSSKSSSCPELANISDGGPGACHFAAALISCTSANGSGCSCLASDPSSGCPGCDASTGFTCHSLCGTNEYAAGCGGPPSNVTYASPPAACTSELQTPAGTGSYCCPCS
ncbi:MAG: hypothetical protein JST54_33855 [Deltaproteobacteria bacterium]|nr:hypothetical protein [Deltaproteobacteria bacterium]